MAYEPEGKSKFLGVIGVATIVAIPVIYILYRIAYYA